MKTKRREGRPPKESTRSTSMTVFVEPSVKETFTVLASERHLTVSTMLELLVKEFIENSG